MLPTLPMFLALLAPPAAPVHALGHTPAVPFEAVVYARYVMTYRDGIYRSYQTASAREAARSVQLRAAPGNSLGLKPFGSWTTADATYDPFNVYGPDRTVPGAVFIYTLDEPGPPAAPHKAAALALFVERPQLSPNEFRTFMARRAERARGAGYRQQLLQGQSIFSRCQQGAGTEYPPMNGAVTQNCVAEVYAPGLTLRAQTLNVSEKATVQQLLGLLRQIR